MPPHDERYDRADEMLEACMALWNTWDEDAFVLDKKSGLFADPSKVHYANYAGKWTKTRGPLPTPRSAAGPSGHHAGRQLRPRPRVRRALGRDHLRRRQRQAERCRIFYDDMHKRIAAHGRDPEKVKIVASVTPIVGETERIAQERADYLESLENPRISISLSHPVRVGADLQQAQDGGGRGEGSRDAGHARHGTHVRSRESTRSVRGHDQAGAGLISSARPR